jgi:chemotaxis protein MotB
VNEESTDEGIVSEHPDDRGADTARHSLASVREKRSSRHIWLISYADFMTILMIFFLAMYGYTYMAKQALIKRQPRFSDRDFTNQISDMKQKLGSQLKVLEDVDKVVLEVSDQILFSSGHAELNPSAGATLDDLAKSVKLMNGDVIVQGHTDDVPVVGGRYKSNWELSAARSFSVIDALTARGVPVKRLSAWGFGENRPMVANDSDEHRALNRRIEVVILKKKPTA